MYKVESNKILCSGIIFYKFIFILCIFFWDFNCIIMRLRYESMYYKKICFVIV